MKRMDEVGEDYFSSRTLATFFVQHCGMSEDEAEDWARRTVLSLLRKFGRGPRPRLIAMCARCQHQFQGCDCRKPGKEEPVRLSYKLKRWHISTDSLIALEAPLEANPKLLPSDMTAHVLRYIQFLLS